MLVKLEIQSWAILSDLSVQTFLSHQERTLKPEMLINFPCLGPPPRTVCKQAQPQIQKFAKPESRAGIPRFSFVHDEWIAYIVEDLGHPTLSGKNASIKFNQRTKKHISIL